jgi:hypothetical protein
MSDRTARTLIGFCYGVAATLFAITMIALATK